MSRLIVESHYDISGNQDVYKDRVRTQPVATTGGLHLTVAAIADGDGHQGDRAAQTALDALFNFLEKSKETNLPALLTQAVQYANKVVHQLQPETGGASTTLTVAVVQNATNTLFIANVGDSRVYLCRNQKLTQLTIDHSFANVMPWMGKISAEAAASHPRAQALMRAIGPKPDVEVDLGFYVGTTDFAEANERGQEGLPLEEGDAVLVCSDGLTKNNPKGEPLITEAEIIRTLQDKEGKTAAKELVSFALGRGPDDNISAAVIQLPKPWRRLRGWRALLAVMGAAIIIICGLVIGLAALSRRAVETNATAQVVAQVQAATGTAHAEEDLATALMAATIAAYTPTPTPSPTATLPPFQPGQAGINSANGAAFTTNQDLLASDPNLQLRVYHKEGLIPEGYVFAFPGSRLRFDSVNDQSFSLLVSLGSKLFVETGNYVRAVLKPVNAPSLTLAVEGSCLALDNTLENDKVLLVSCYEGACTYDVFGGEQGAIPEGQQLLIDTTHLIALTPQNIPPPEAEAWASQLPAGSAVQNCALKFVPTPMPNVVPTQEQPTGDDGNSDSTINPPGNIPTQTPGPPPATLPPTVTPPRTSTPPPIPIPTATPLPGVTPIPTIMPSPVPTNTPTDPMNTPKPTCPPNPTPTPDGSTNPKCV